MKFISRFLGIALMFSVLFVNAQNRDLIKVTALRVGEEITAPYQSRHQGPNFDVSPKGILRPHKGYQIVLNKVTGQFRVAPEKYLYLKLDGSFDVQPIPGGMMWCFCGGSNDDCDISLVASENKLIYKCAGRCGCIRLTESDPDSKILGYETAGGRWFNF